MTELAPLPLMSPPEHQPGHPSYDHFGTGHEFDLPPVAGTRDPKTGERFNPPLTSDHANSNGKDKNQGAATSVVSQPKMQASPDVTPTPPQTPELPPIGAMIKAPFKAAKESTRDTFGRGVDAGTYGVVNGSKKYAKIGATKAYAGAHGVLTKKGRAAKRSGKVQHVTPQREVLDTAQLEQRRKENEEFWRVASMPMVAIPGADARYNAEAKEGIDVTKNPYPENTVPVEGDKTQESRRKQVAAVILGAVVVGAVAGVAANKNGKPVPLAAGLAGLGAAGAGLAALRVKARREASLPADEASGEAEVVVENEAPSTPGVDLSKPEMKKGISEDDIHNSRKVWSSLSEDERRAFTEHQKNIEDVMRANPDNYIDSDEYKKAYGEYYKIVGEIIERHKDLRIPDTDRAHERRKATEELNQLAHDAAVLRENMESSLTFLPKKLRESINRPVKAAYDAKVAEQLAKWEEHKEAFKPAEVVNEPVDPGEPKAERRKLSPRAKKVLAGVGIAAVAAGAAYVAKEKVPEEVKDKAKEKVVEAASKVKAAAPTKETVAKGKEHAQVLYSRASAKGSKLAAKAAAAVKNRK